MKSEMEKCGRFLVIAIFFLFFISTAQGAFGNDELVYAKGTSGGPVHNIDTAENFTTIQAAIDDPDTKDGHTISVDAGYPKPGISPKPVVINKQLKLIGKNKDTTIIDGSGRGNCILVTADNVEISGFTIQNGNYGVYLESSNCRVTDNNIISVNFDGIFLSNSVNNTIAHNSLSEVKRRGIRLSSSSNNRIHDNDLLENDEGIVLFASQDNVIYHNNFIDNRNQAKDNRDTNRWDNGPEDGGNYWSDYKCTGNPSDGSQPYNISFMGPKDNYPFMDRDGWKCTVPSPPTLTDPGTSDNDGNYVVSWSSVSSATNYTLEEDTSSSFSSPTTVYSGSETSKEITGKSDGTYYYQVKACNECGCSEWSNIENITIKIDTILPTVTITYPTNEQTLTTPNITVNGNASDNVAVSKVEVKVGSGDWQTASGTKSWSTSVKLETGSNTINAQATDTSGNINQTSVMVFVIGESSVTISAVPSTINLSESVNISGNITRAHSANVTLTFTTPNDATQKNSITSTPNGSYYFVFQPEEVGKWTVNATWAGDSDTAGNTSKTVSFIVIGESSVTISVIPSTINLSESVNISGNITRAHSANVTLTFTTPNDATQKNSITSTPNGSYYFVFPPEEVGKWTVNATWAGDFDTAGNTSKTVSFIVIGDESRVTISVIPSTINLSESVNISGNITRAHSANVTLTFTTPNKATQKNSTTSTPNGSYYFVFRPEEVGKWTVNATWAGDSDIAGNTSKTVSFTVNADKVGYAIIIAGSRKDGSVSDAIDYSAKNTYSVLLNKCSFTDKRIFYLNSSRGQDVNGDDKDFVDKKISSRANITYAIEKWAAQDKVSANAPLLIYMVGKIENDTFFVNGANDTLTVSDLNNSLNNLANETKCDNITVVCEACYSGSFIDDLSCNHSYNLSSQRGRIIITSTDVYGASMFCGERGGEFSYCFFDNISSGISIKDAFETASNSTKILENNKVLEEYNKLLEEQRFLPQRPWLDDNGDGNGSASPLNATGDGPLAASRHIGTQGNGHSYNICIPAIRLEGV